MASTISDPEFIYKMEYAGENYLGEESYKTPSLSTPDSCVTDTLSCPTEREAIMKGDFVMNAYRCPAQLTLALIKPDGMKYVEQIERRMRNEGFDIIQKRRVHLSPEQASDFYYEQYGSPHFPLLVASLCEGPIQAYVLRRKAAIKLWKLVCGPPDVEEAKRVWPESLRAIYGSKNQNVCHASETSGKAREEIRFFFPKMILERNLVRAEEVEDYIKEKVNPTLLEGLTQVCRNKPVDPVKWLATWLLMHNPNKPKMAENVTLTPT